MSPGPDERTRVAVTSRSFSTNPTLRSELLRRYSRVTFNELGTAFAESELVDFLRDHDKAIVALDRITEDIIAQLPDLKVISKYGVGLDMIDLDALTRHGVRLGWRPGVNRRSVSELVISAAIVLLRHLHVANREMREGRWRQHVGSHLTGRTVGIVGLGHIGKDLAVLLRAFDCRVLAHDIVTYPDFCTQHAVTQLSLEAVLAESELVTIHLPLDSSTRRMFNATVLDLIRPGAVLINAARGGIVDEMALKIRLQTGQIAGAALDVFADEPPQDLELLQLPNVFATPHLGGSALEAVLAMGRAAIEELDNE